jgi:FkbM family methyltransferase
VNSSRGGQDDGTTTGECWPDGEREGCLCRGRPGGPDNGQEVRVTTAKSIVSAGILATKSVEFDLKLMRVRTLPLQWRLRFVVKKYRTLLRLRFGRPAKFEIEPLSLLIRDISGLGTLQSSIIDFFNDVVSSGVLGTAPLIVDVGANVGQFANAAKLFFPEARIISFEPDPETYADLQVNTHGLRDVDLDNIGLGDREGVLTFYRHKLSVMSSFGVQADDMAHHRGSTELPVRRLDAVLDSDDRPDLLKIDVEGFERQVLQGAWETVTRSRYILIEVSLGRADGAGNLQLLRDIVEHAPNAAIIRFGRPLGDPHLPTCQDVLISVQGAPHAASSAVLQERDGARAAAASSAVAEGRHDADETSTPW